MEKNNKAIMDLISRYKQHVREHGLQDELYKWELLQKFRGRPDVNAEDFSKEVHAVDFKNLAYGIGRGVLRHIAKEQPEQLRECIKALFDEGKPLVQRIKAYDQSTLALYRHINLDEDKGHHQDERMAGLLLAFHDPEKYPIYKASFYDKFCTHLGIPPKGKGEKYAHYLSLLQDFITHYIAPDGELLEMMQDALPEGVFPDRQHLLLAQNVLYVVLEQGVGNEKQVSDENRSISNTMNSTFQSPLNQILYGPPGTGKTFNTINKALEILRVAYDPEDRPAMKRIFEQHLAEGRIAFTTFHQSMSYEDFVEGIKPQMLASENSLISYEIEAGIFKSLSEKASSNFFVTRRSDSLELTFEEALEKLVEDWEADTDMQIPMKSANKGYTILGFSKSSIPFKKANGSTSHSLSISTLREFYYGREMEAQHGIWIYYPGILSKLRSYQTEKPAKRELLPHILIIDEINRGNVSQIFGELITLIEEDKRAGKPEALSVTLPYSKDSFSVPPNLYIIGTMNTADRSVEALDTALRRRFEFVEMPPKPNLLRENPNDEESKLLEVNGLILRDLLHTLNIRIEKLLDRDHQIGHAYFMEVRDLKALKNAFQHKLLPLLQEYFYGDYAKIGLVLGSGFVHEAASSTQKAKEFFADFKSDHASDLMEKQVWHLRNIEGMTDETFLEALAAMKIKPYAAE